MLYPISKIIFRYAVILLNPEISNKDRLIKLWNRATFRVLVDGAANNWFTLVKDRSEDIVDPTPHLVSGDFDSICPKIRKYYETEVPDCRVVHTPDENYTDFTKALYEIVKDTSKIEGIERIYAFTEHSGRLDQIFALFETLFHATNIPNLPPVHIVSSNSIDWLLDPGKHIIDLQSDQAKDTEYHFEKKLEDCYCGLIPLGEPCANVKTSGLKWNLDGNQTLAFGTLVSTSNGFVDTNITIETKKPILWTMEG